MRVLAIDSSTDMLSVAAADDEGLAERSERAGQSHSERALPLVDAVLGERGWSLAGADGIAFGAGPGSFTGVRIACGIVAPASGTRINSFFAASNPLRMASGMPRALPMAAPT